MPDPSLEPALRMGQERELPPTVVHTYLWWRRWQWLWSATYIVIGVLSATSATLVAANVKTHFLDENATLGLACVTAVLSFLGTALGAQARGAAFETASRELEKAKKSYALGSGTAKDLDNAIQRGIDILNRLKPS